MANNASDRPHFFDCLRLFAPAGRRARGLPVSENGRPVGVIGRTDIIRTPLA